MVLTTRGNITYVTKYWKKLKEDFGTYLFLRSFEISSRVLFFVSGTNSPTKSMAEKHMAV